MNYYWQLIAYKNNDKCGFELYYDILNKGS